MLSGGNKSLHSTLSCLAVLPVLSLGQGKPGNAKPTVEPSVFVKSLHIPPINTCKKNTKLIPFHTTL